MIAAAFPLALVVGLIGELVAAAPSRIAGRRGRPSLRRQLKELSSPAGGRPAVVEAGGALAALLGSALAAGAAVGLGPGSVALAYLGLVLSAVGGHVAASAEVGDRPRRDRLGAALVEPAFVVALGATVLRWGSSGLDAVRGTQTVLGPGISVGTVPVAIGLGLAGLVLTVAGALRLASPPSVPAAPALLVRFARSAGAGATALVVAALVAGADLGQATVDRVAVFAGSAVAAVVVLEWSDRIFRRAGRRWGMGVALTLLVASVASIVLVTR